MSHTTITANASEQLLLSTDALDRGVSLRVVAGGTLGGGTLTILTRAQTADADVIYQTLDTLAVGSAYTYDIGRNTEVAYTLSGATSPSFVLIAERIPA